jgi:Flp pilus assembly protein CpaB
MTRSTRRLSLFAASFLVVALLAMVGKAYFAGRDSHVVSDKWKDVKEPAPIPQGKAMILHAIRDLPAGAPVKENAFEYRLVPERPLPEKAIRSYSEWQGNGIFLDEESGTLRTIRPMKAGELVTFSDVERRHGPIELAPTEPSPPEESLLEPAEQAK